ncbi:hypothetical protein JTE90_009623 [Oedothorax gibbosus]|uniref:Uncharacterized protein n=1 Tax=Oedothorax gibbosus TaxID=931172 RepID=A0AAV6TMN1_9ARAC|nr:hypothetical protein JTE90_009623 [Oedothorax gibbosus]
MRWLLVKKGKFKGIMTAQNGHTDIECTFYRTGSSGLIEKTEIEHTVEQIPTGGHVRMHVDHRDGGGQKGMSFFLKVLTT